MIVSGCGSVIGKFFCQLSDMYVTLKGCKCGHSLAFLPERVAA